MEKETVRVIRRSSALWLSEDAPNASRLDAKLKAIADETGNDLSCNRHTDSLDWSPHIPNGAHNTLDLAITAPHSGLCYPSAFLLWEDSPMPRVETDYVPAHHRQSGFPIIRFYINNELISNVHYEGLIRDGKQAYSVIAHTTQIAAGDTLRVSVFQETGQAMPLLAGSYLGALLIT